MELEKLLKDFKAAEEDSELICSFSSQTCLPPSALDEGQTIHAQLLVSGDCKAFISKAKLDDPSISVIGLMRCPVLGRWTRRVKDISLAVLSPSASSPSNSSNYHLLDDAIENDRRLTSRNIMKWIQQLSTTLFGIHRNYVTLSDLNLQDIALCGEINFIHAVMKWIKPKQQPAEVKADDSRQAWFHSSTASKMSVFTELRKTDRLLTGSCSSKMDKESVFQSELYGQFTTYCQGVQANLRDLGIILIQMINRQLFTSDEYNHWKRWKVEVEPNPSGAPIKASRSDSNAPSKREAENALAKRQITETKQQLLMDLPILKSVHPLVADVLALCFASLSTPTIERQESRKGLSLVSMRFPSLKSYKAVVSSLEDAVVEIIDSGKFVKEDLWTVEDEKRRIKAMQANKKRLKQKAVEGVKAAAARIKASNHEIWWSMQSEEFRTKIKRQKRNQQRYYSNRKKEQHAIQNACFHYWTVQEIQPWIEQGLSEYVRMIVDYHQQVEKMKPKKPEIFITQMIGDVLKPFDDSIISKFTARYSHSFMELLKSLYVSENTDAASDGSSVSLSFTMLSKMDNVQHIVTKILSSAIPKQLLENSTAMELRKEFDKARQVEKDQLEGKLNDILIISPEQLRYKRLVIQAKHFSSQFTTLRKEILKFTRGLDIVDREFARTMAYLFSLSMLMKFFNEGDIRLQGENVAASRLQAFFRMIKTRKEITIKLQEKRNAKRQHGLHFRNTHHDVVTNTAAADDYQHHHHTHSASIETSSPTPTKITTPQVMNVVVKEHQHRILKSSSDSVLKDEAVVERELSPSKKKPLSTSTKSRPPLPPTFEILSYQVKTESILFHCKVVTKNAAAVDLWLNSQSVVKVETEATEQGEYKLTLSINDGLNDTMEDEERSWNSSYESPPETEIVESKLSFSPQRVERVLLFSIRLIKLIPGRRYSCFITIDRSLEQSLLIGFERFKEGEFSSCQLKWCCPQSLMGISYGVQAQSKHILQIVCSFIMLDRLPPPILKKQLSNCQRHCKSTKDHIPWSLLESAVGQRLPLYFYFLESQHQLCNKCTLDLQVICECDFGDRTEKRVCDVERRFFLKSLGDSQNQYKVASSSWDKLETTLHQSPNNRRPMINVVEDKLNGKELLGQCKEWIYPLISTMYVELLGKDESSLSQGYDMVETGFGLFTEYHFKAGNDHGCSSEFIKIKFAEILVNRKDLGQIGKFRNPNHVNIIGKMLSASTLGEHVPHTELPRQGSALEEHHDANNVNAVANDGLEWLNSLEFVSPLLANNK